MITPCWGNINFHIKAESTGATIKGIKIIDLKKDVFKKLDTICKSECIFASNTSSFRISELAQSVSVQRQTQFIGLHFFNPVAVMKLVEIILANTTSKETKELCQSYCSSIGKETVFINDSPGFATTRMVALIINEACNMLDEGLGTIEDIDKAIKLGLAHPMGPLTLADLIGLDTASHILEYLFSELKQDKFNPSPTLKQKIGQGKLGKKTGEGFYKYWIVLIWIQ